MHPTGLPWLWRQRVRCPPAPLGRRLALPGELSPPTKAGFGLLQVWGRRAQPLGGDARACGGDLGPGQPLSAGSRLLGWGWGGPWRLWPARATRSSCEGQRCPCCPCSLSAPRRGCLHRQDPRRCADSSPDPLPQPGGGHAAGDDGSVAITHPPRLEGPRDGGGCALPPGYRGGSRGMPHLWLSRGCKLGWIPCPGAEKTPGGGVGGY